MKQGKEQGYVVSLENRLLVFDGAGHAADLRSGSERPPEERGRRRTDRCFRRRRRRHHLYGLALRGKPDVCVKGAETVSTLGSRAREGARVAYSYLDEKFADPAQLAAADSVTTGTVTSAAAAPEAGAQAGTARHIPIPTPRPAP
ncbi:DUF5330 domain-containing protein [Rhizobium sp. G21]|nr:DUF5330 domain-containing protein [Rhizobium sp. G21]